MDDSKKTATKIGSSSSRRTFIQSVLGQLTTLGIGSLFVSRHAQAIEHLQKLPNPLTSDMQNNLLNEPKRQMLIAEDADCLDKSFLTSPKLKGKCLSGWPDV